MCLLRITPCQILVTPSAQVKASAFFDDVCDCENDPYRNQMYPRSLCPWNSSAWQLYCAALGSSLAHVDGDCDDDGYAAGGGAVHLCHIAYRACPHIHRAAYMSHFLYRYLLCYLWLACQATFLTRARYKRRADFAYADDHPGLLFVSLILGQLYCPLEVAEA